MKNSEFISFIVARRKELNLSQNDLASALGYSSQLVHNWEKGKSLPDLSILSALADVLRISLDDLLNVTIKEDKKDKYPPFDIGNFSENLKKLRVISSLTQKDVAEKCGVSYATIISWEKGASTPNINQFILLSELYKVSYEDLYFGKFSPILSKGKATSFKIPFITMAGALVLSLLGGGHFIYKTTHSGPDLLGDGINSTSSEASSVSGSEGNFPNDDIVIVKFYNYDKSFLWSTEAERGSAYIYHGIEPTRFSDGKYIYIFDKFVETDRETVEDGMIEDKETIYFIAEYKATEIVDSTDIFETTPHDGGVLITGAKYHAPELVIPNRIGDYDVVGISFAAFKEDGGLTKITISEGIKTLYATCFMDCYALEEVILPESLKVIEDEVFRNCFSLNKVRFPSTMEKIGIYAFHGCENLKEASIPYGIEVLSRGIFSNCFSLKNLTIPSSVHTIQGYSIDQTAIKYITIPSSVRTLEQGSFYCSNLKGIYVSEGVETIKREFCNLEYADFAILPKSLKKWFVQEGDFSVSHNKFYYSGTEEEFRKITFYGYTPSHDKSDNVVYFSETYEPGKWHYVDNIPTIYA